MSPSLMEPGKPHIFLLSDRQREKDHIKNYTRSSDAIAEYGDIIDILFEIVETRQLTENAIQLLVDRLDSRFKVIYEQAARRLVELSHYFEQADSVLLELMSHRKSSIRLRIVQSLLRNTPPKESTDVIVMKGLHDKSASVRQFAASRIGQLRMKHLLPELKCLLETETDENVLAEIHCAFQNIDDNNK